MKQQEISSLTEKELQELLTEALQAFPEKPEQSIKQEWLKKYKLAKLWPDGYELCKALCDLPDDILNDPKISGRFLYSNISTLRKGKFFLLEFSPDVDPDLSNNLPLCSEIRKWSANKCGNAYVCENWDILPGEHKIQKSVQELCTTIGSGLNITRQVCASNLIFCRSEKTDNALEKWGGYLKDFLRIHEAILKIVKPSCIFAIGARKDERENNTYRIVKNFLGFSDIKDITFPSGHWNYSCFVVEEHCKQLNQQIKLIGVPDFSRFVLDIQALEWIAKECRKSVTKSRRNASKHP